MGLVLEMGYKKLVSRFIYLDFNYKRDKNMKYEKEYKRRRFSNSRNFYTKTIESRIYELLLVVSPV